MKPSARLCLALTATLALAGCAAPYGTVTKRRPAFHPIDAVTGALAGVPERINDASRWGKKRPLLALGDYLAVAEAASKQLQANPKDAAALESYNFAVARVLGTIKEAKLDPWSKPLAIPSADGGYLLTHRPDARPTWNPALYDFMPADEFDVKGRYVSERETKAGVGAPVVAMGKRVNAEAATNFGMQKTFYGVTGVIRFHGRTAEIAFEDPLSAEEVALGGKRLPLAADYTVPLAVLLQQAEPQKLEISRLLQPEKYAHTARISRLQPYDPNKTVVLVIHGLMDTPATWTPLINKLRSDADIRKNYQFWFYSYPSGYPYAYSASILRSQLDAVEKKFPLRKPMVVIGHSMGGCISRLLITDPGERLWQTILGRSPRETKFMPETRRLLTDTLLFKHRPEVGRVIFISSPLRGADMAVNPLGRIGSSLVRTPRALLDAGADAFNTITFQDGDLVLRRMPNSIDSLAPNNRFVKAINTLPLVKGVPVHVIAGDRGRGGNKDQTKPVMSDGVVPYWSSHIPEAKSELIVPSNHSAHQNPAAINEVVRILKLHAGG
ncbi:MAG: esterase/lipase family protein [Chthoniobacterales bacterium]